MPTSRARTHSRLAQYSTRSDPVFHSLREGHPLGPSPRDNSLLGLAEAGRTGAWAEGPRPRQRELAQYFTPAPIARLMASLFRFSQKGAISILDPGAGVGALSLATLDRILGLPAPPAYVSLIAYELDSDLAAMLDENLNQAQRRFAANGLRLEFEIRQQDFILKGITLVHGGLFTPSATFDLVITNPPYKKISTESAHRQAVRSLGLETSNIYAAFLALSAQLLAQDGQMVSITPRSFCNGRYFEAFRKFFLERMAIRQIHSFASRKAPFADDSVLQESVILHTTKGLPAAKRITVSHSESGNDPSIQTLSVPQAAVVNPADPEAFIAIPLEAPDESGNTQTSGPSPCCTQTVAKLGLAVSTGRVVMFRCRALIRDTAGSRTVPFVHAENCRSGIVQWPHAKARHPQYFEDSVDAEPLLMDSGFYVVVRRLSSKEESRRLHCAVFDPSQIPGKRVAFENHLNVIHANGVGLSKEMAYGLATFLNSSIADREFRRFSGHTQVNAGDLRRLKVPSEALIVRIAHRVRCRALERDKIDEIISVLLAAESAAPERAS